MLTEWHPDRLWYADSITGSALSQRLQRMMVVRLEDNQLVIISPIELTTHLQLEISELGTIAAIVSPCPNKHQALSDWWLSYPQAYFLATPTLIQKRSDLNFDQALGRQSFPLWKHQLLQTCTTGFKLPRKALFCDPVSETLILPDFLIAPQEHLPNSQRLQILLGGGYSGLQLPLSERRQVDSPTRLRAFIQEVMTWPFDKILASNGIVVDSYGKERFYQAFKWCFRAEE